MPFSTHYTAITTALQYVAASVDNPRELSSDNATANINPPLYVWDPQSISDAGKRGELTGNSNPKGLGYDAHLWTVWCWGATRDDCERMRAALIRAVREELGGGGNISVGAAQWDYPDAARNGYVLAIPLTFYLPLVSVEIPTGAATGIPEDDLTNDTYETVTITAINPLDTTGAVAGDDELQGGEG